MSEKKLIDDYLNYDLSDEDLDKLRSDKQALEQIDVEEFSDKLSKEFFNPGYGALMADKKEQFAKVIREDGLMSGNETQARPRKLNKTRIGVLALAVIVLSAIIYMFSTNGKQKKTTIEEVKQYAMLSYESTGALNANRGESQSPNQLSENYKLLLEGNCDELTLNGKYIEQELWSQLYCAYLNNDEEKIDYFKSQIIDKKYFNYSKLN